MVMPVASQTSLVIQMVSMYKITAAAISLKSPREKEKSMINVKQQTIAGPRSPNIKNSKMVAPMANRAKKKKENRLTAMLETEIIKHRLLDIFRQRIRFTLVS